MKFIFRVFLILIITLQLNAKDGAEHTISFNTSYEQEVLNDLVIVTMQITKSDSSSENVINYINQNSNKIEQIIKNYNEVSFATTGYSVFPRYSDNEIKGFSGNYNFELESMNYDVLNEALQEIQKYAIYRGLNFTISKELGEKVKSQILAIAIEKHLEKAKEIAKSFGAAEYKLKSTNIDDNLNMNMPYREFSQAVSLRSQAPSLSSGESTVIINISSTIALDLD